MSKFFNDETRALIVALFPDIIYVAVSLGLDVSSEQQALLTSLATKLVVLVFYIFKTGQNQGPDGNSLVQQKKDDRA